MATVYIVTVQYDDHSYDIVGVFSTREKAQKYILDSGESLVDPDIELWDVDREE